ncbi:hypothetical protein GCM10009821_09450 [Aeromicrobium halocynthiae]|uniref:Uncharacterized protein n=1 Tax=Aeromicrobium halocynthiae TaxID=560557 RepID=A0ABN2VVB0_9ACTN
MGTGAVACGGDGNVMVRVVQAAGESGAGVDDGTAGRVSGCVMGMTVEPRLAGVVGGSAST